MPRVELERALVGLAERDGDAVLPGTTHIQPAQPVLLAHHLLAYVEMLERDRGRLADCRRRTNVSPLGAGALAGAGYPLDREATARELGFDGVTANSLDAVSTATSSVEFVAAAALAMVHLSRFAEELTWWSNPALRLRPPVGCVLDRQLDDAEQEEPRPGRAGPRPAARVIGALAGLLALVKGLPLAYQRDLQEDKPPLFEAAATLEASLDVMTGLVARSRRPRPDARGRRRGFITATAVADALVRRGVAFRAAHHVVGALVAAAEARASGSTRQPTPRSAASLRPPTTRSRGAWPQSPGSPPSCAARPASTPRSPRRT